MGALEHRTWHSAGGLGRGRGIALPQQNHFNLMATMPPRRGGDEEKKQLLQSGERKVTAAVKEEEEESPRFRWLMLVHEGVRSPVRKSHAVAGEKINARKVK